MAFSPAHILEHLPSGALCLDAEGRIQFANARAARLLGWCTPEELVDQPIHTYIQFSGLGSTGQELCVRDDGTSFPIEYEAEAMADGDEGYVLTLRDISQRRAADQRRDELIGQVSHELRTPLTAIRSSLGLLASGLLGKLSDQGQSLVDIGVSNTERLIRLVNDLLDFERLNSGHETLRLKMCNVAELMQQAADSVRTVANSANVRIEIAPTLAQLPADPDRLLQVLINLLANAIKFSPRYGGSVWLDAEDCEGELVVRVRDEGRGIPADKLETIFERFAQVDERSARHKRGTGLGLAISRAIVEQHGGQIWAESAPGAGTTLCVALPMTAALDDELQTAA